MMCKDWLFSLHFRVPGREHSFQLLESQSAPGLAEKFFDFSTNSLHLLKVSRKARRCEKFLRRNGPRETVINLRCPFSIQIWKRREILLFADWEWRFWGFSGFQKVEVWNARTFRFWVLQIFGKKLCRWKKKFEYERIEFKNREAGFQTQRIHESFAVLELKERIDYFGIKLTRKEEQILQLLSFRKVTKIFAKFTSPISENKISFQYFKNVKCIVA